MGPAKSQSIMGLGSEPRIWRPASRADVDEAAWVLMTETRCSGSRDLMNLKEKLSTSRQRMCISESRTGCPLWTLAFNKKQSGGKQRLVYNNSEVQPSVPCQGTVNSAFLGPSSSPWQWILLVPPSELSSSEIVLTSIRNVPCSHDPISQTSFWESEKTHRLFSFSNPCPFLSPVLFLAQFSLKFCTHPMRITWIHSIP